MAANRHYETYLYLRFLLYGLIKQYRQCVADTGWWRGGQCKQCSIEGNNRSAMSHLRKLHFSVFSGDFLRQTDASTDRRTRCWSRRWWTADKADVEIVFVNRCTSAPNDARSDWFIASMTSQLEGGCVYGGGCVRRTCSIEHPTQRTIRRLKVRSLWSVNRI